MQANPKARKALDAAREHLDHAWAQWLEADGRYVQQKQIETLHYAVDFLADAVEALYEALIGEDK